MILTTLAQRVMNFLIVVLRSAGPLFAQAD
jgi:hypothetical protein